MFMRIVVCIGLVFFLESSLQSFESFDEALEFVSLQYDAAVQLGLQKNFAKISSSQQENIFVEMFQLINHHEAIYLEEIAEDIQKLESVIQKNINNKKTAQQKYLQKSVESLQFFYQYAKKHRSFYHFLHKINALERGFYADNAEFENKDQNAPAQVLGERYRIYENAKYPVMEYADKLDRDIKRLSKFAKRSGRSCVQEYLDKVVLQAKALHAKVLLDKDYRAEFKTHQDLHPKRLISEKTLVAAFASLWMGAMIVTAIVYAAVFAQS